MYARVSRSEFVNWFREHRPNKFTFSCLDVIFDLIESIEESTGKEIEFDPIAICCDYNEYTIKELIRAYDDNDEMNMESFDDEAHLVEWFNCYKREHIVDLFQVGDNWHVLVDEG